MSVIFWHEFFPPPAGKVLELFEPWNSVFLMILGVFRRSERTIPVVIIREVDSKYPGGEGHRWTCDLTESTPNVDWSSELQILVVTVLLSIQAHRNYCFPSRRTEMTLNCIVDASPWYPGPGGGVASAVSSVQIQRILEMDRSKIIELIWFSLSDCKIMWKPSCGITGDCFVRWMGKKTIFVGRSIADELFFGVCSNCVSLWVKISEYVKTRRMRTGNFGFRDPNLGKSIWKNTLLGQNYTTLAPDLSVCPSLIWCRTEFEVRPP